MVRKKYQIILFVLICLLINLCGRWLSSRFELFIWLDCVGTALAAYALGPFSGCAVGVTGNLIYSIYNQTPTWYLAVSVAIALITGFAARRRLFDTAFGAMAVGGLATVVSVLIIVPLNYMYYNGSTGNIWGNGVASYFRELGVPAVLSTVLGELYTEFLDKMLTVLVLFLLIRLIRRLRGRKPAAEAPVFLLLILAGMTVGRPWRAEAEIMPAVSEAHIDYNDYVQTIFSSKNGLPCGEANDIAQTNDGVLWIGTYAGLYRYDGRDFRVMNEFESVRNVNCLYVDEEGRLWIGTNDNGLSICINNNVVNVVDETGGLPSNSVRCITRSSDGIYYIGTTRGMLAVTLDSGLKIQSTIDRINYADAITADQYGNVIVIDSEGELFVLKGGSIQATLKDTAEDGSEFNCCAFSPDGHLYVGTAEDTIIVYDISSGGFLKEKELVCDGLKNLNHICFLDNGEVFVVADNGIGYFNQQGFFELINTNEFNNSIDNMLVDYQGNLWFTSSRLGLLRLAPSSFQDVYRTIGMENRVVNAIEEWHGDYYVGTDKGLDVLDGSLRQQLKNDLTKELKGVRIRCIKKDSKDNLWICTYGNGLLKVSPDGQYRYYNRDNGSFGNKARVVQELSDGTILAAGDTGISVIRDGEIVKNIQYEDGLTNTMILTLTELPDGRVLAGTDGDGIAILENDEITGMLTREDGLSSGVILRTISDSKGEGVFLVTSNGLCFLDEDLSIRTLDKFPYYNNYDIWCGDNNRLFVMSSAGIYVVDRDELLAPEGGDLVYELLDARRGLNSALTANSWNYSDDEGRLFLPCDTGVFTLDTKGYNSGGRSYRLMISSLSLDGNQYQISNTQPLTVERDVSKIEIYPEILNYSIENPYAGYYLEGFDQEWAIVPQSELNHIMYTNLPAGDYVFHLAVFNNQGEILEQRSYNLIKEKEIQDNQWFRIYLIAVGILIVAWVTWFAGRMHLQRTLNLQQQELEMTRRQVQMGNEAIVAIARTVDAKDVRTSRHSYRVSQYSVRIAEELGFDEKECENLRRAALTHDIGKIGIPDRILNKPDRLTDEEYVIMKSHVIKGAEILKDMTMLDHVVEGAKYHHERYDGRGYPEGLKGEEIPLYGRIIGVTDAFDAMTVNRVYRKKMDMDYVLNEMRKGRGTQFDPKIVDVFLELLESGKISLDELYAQKNEDTE